MIHSLDLSSLQKAISQLEEALEYCQSELAMNDTKLAQHLRAAAITPKRTIREI